MSLLETLYLAVVALLAIVAAFVFVRRTPIAHTKAECLKLNMESFCWAHEWPSVVIAIVVVLAAAVALFLGVQEVRSTVREIAVVSVVPLAAWTVRRRHTEVRSKVYIAAVGLWMGVTFNCVVLLGFIERWKR